MATTKTSVYEEDDNPCHAIATLSDSTNSVWNYSDVGLFMVGVKVWVLEHFSILYRLMWVLMFHHLAHGLAELWLRRGVGDKTRFIPVHVTAVTVGKRVCEVFPATCVLTGCDITSKFGTKAAGIKAQPVLYLKDFGRARSDV